MSIFDDNYVVSFESMFANNDGLCLVDTNIRKSLPCTLLVSGHRGQVIVQGNPQAT